MGKTTRLNVELTATDKTKGVFSKTAKNMEQFNKKTGKMGVISTKTSKTVKDLGNGYEKIRITTKKTNAEGRKQVAVQESIAKTHQKFNMNALGVMFAGMAMQRTFSNLNKTAREWVGMNELMSTAMGVVMLPATMDLLEFGVLPLFDALTSLPEPAQKAIGGMSIALEGLGGTLMTGGQLALGLTSIASILKSLGGDAGYAAGAAKSLKTLGGIGLVTVGVTLGMTSILSEDGTTSILTALGSALALALGGIMLGASIGGGILIGGLTIAAIAAAKLAINWTLGVEKFSDELKDLGFDEGQIAQEVSKTFLPGGAATRARSGGLEAAFGGGLGSLGKISLNPIQTLLNIFGAETGDPNLAVGGKVRNTGRYFLHEGEEVIPKTGVSDGVNMNVTYYVTVSDKREFEQMLKANTNKLTADVRRMSKI